jgi:hypothetical protein
MRTSAVHTARSAHPSRKPLGAVPHRQPVLRVVPAPPPPVWQRMRCACRHCGVHTVTNVGYTVAGHCPNCGSYELTPISAA